MGVSYFIISSFAMPNAQGGTSPKGAEGGRDYKAFFDKYVEGKKAERARLEQSINPKMSESEKLSIERQMLDIDREMFQMEANPAPALNAVEERIRSMKLDPAKENYLLNAAKQVSNEQEATALLDFITDFTGATGDKTPDAPASLDTPAGEGDGQAVPVGYKVQDIINPETRDIAKANIEQLV